MEFLYSLLKYIKSIEIQVFGLSVHRCVKLLLPVIQTRWSSVFSSVKMQVNFTLKSEAEQLLGVLLKKGCHRIAVLFEARNINS